MKMHLIHIIDTQLGLTAFNRLDPDSGMNLNENLVLISKPDRTNHEMPCKRSTIQNYQPACNDKTSLRGGDICQECIDKFLKGEGSICAKLFPTKAMKKRFGQK